jgi:cobyrinic acid a,c-diamide synthase
MRMATLADAIEASIDVDGIVAAGHQSSGFPNTTSQAMKPPGQRIALARDAAFSFTYNHVLAGWRKAGAEIFPFSPLADEAPSAIADAVWLPGGYPELYAGQLAGKSRFLSGLRALAERRIPIHGECGGYMVLGQGLEDAEGQRHAMAGLLKAETSFRSRKLHLGYRRAVLRSNCVLGRKGAQLYGHEFHYATLVSDVGETLMDVADGTGVIRSAGSRAGSVTGSFFHLLSAAETAA